MKVKAMETYHTRTTIASGEAISAVATATIRTEVTWTVAVYVYETGIAVAIATDITLKACAALLHHYCTLGVEVVCRQRKKTIT